MKERMKRIENGYELMVREFKKEIRFLFLLRETGVVNMFQAPQYLEEYFNLNSNIARDVVMFWMTNYEKLLKDERITQ